MVKKKQRYFVTFNVKGKRKRHIRPLTHKGKPIYSKTLAKERLKIAFKKGKKPYRGVISNIRLKKRKSI